jgi:hypothetical protein
MKKTILFILGFLFVMNIWAQESKVEKIEVNLKYLFGLGTIDFNDIDESISSMGLGIEVNPGYKILSTPNMDFGIVYGFIMLAGETSFSETRSIAGFPNQIYEWDVSTMTIGTHAKAKYNFNFDNDLIQIDLHNSIGLGYMFTNLDAEGVNVGNNDDKEDKGESNEAWTPIIDGGIRITFPVGETSRLGLIADVLASPFIAGDY